MTVTAPDAETRRAISEMSLLVDIGSAWTKAAVVGRSLGRWRIAAHAAQPTSWDDEELIATLAARLTGRIDPRLAGRIAAQLADAPRIAVPTPVRPGRIALAAVSSELSGQAARRAAGAAGWGGGEAGGAGWVGGGGTRCRRRWPAGGRAPLRPTGRRGRCLAAGRRL